MVEGAHGKGESPDAQAKRRRERLAAELRENLKRRKAQQRGRASNLACAPEPERAPDGSH